MTWAAVPDPSGAVIDCAWLGFCVEDAFLRQGVGELGGGTRPQHSGRRCET
jgi:hypothetical protein